MNLPGRVVFDIRGFANAGSTSTSSTDGIGAAISVNGDGTIIVPDRPIIPYVVGDGIGVDVTPAMRAVTDAAIGQGSR